MKRAKSFEIKEILSFAPKGITTKEFEDIVEGFVLILHFFGDGSLLVRTARLITTGLLGGIAAANAGDELKAAPQVNRRGFPDETKDLLHRQLRCLDPALVATGAASLFFANQSGDHDTMQYCLTGYNLIVIFRACLDAVYHNNRRHIPSGLASFASNMNLAFKIPGSRMWGGVAGIFSLVRGARGILDNQAASTLQRTR